MLQQAEPSSRRRAAGAGPTAAIVSRVRLDGRQRSRRTHPPARPRPLPGAPAAAHEPAAPLAWSSDLGLWERERASRRRARGWLLNMVASVDGQAALAGRSGAAQRPAPTARCSTRCAPQATRCSWAPPRFTQERYGRMIKDPAVRELRVARGLATEPLACIVSGSLSLESSIPLLAEHDARVIVLTRASGELARDARAGRLRTLRARRQARSCRRRFSELRERFAVEPRAVRGRPAPGARAVRRSASSTNCSCRSRRSLAGAPERARAACAHARRRRARPPGRARARATSSRSSSTLFLRYDGAPPRALVSRETIAQQLARELTALGGDVRRRRDPHHHLVAVELLERDPRAVADRRLQRASRGSPAGRRGSCPREGAPAG